jgi:phosphoribosylamine--glycine ligase
LREVLQATVDGMAAEGRPFTGFLYAGLMITPQGEPKVLEFNVRMGDPETQPIMLRLKTDFVEIIEAAIDGRLDGISAGWDPRPALGVVMAAAGYPADVRKGDMISGLDGIDGESAKIFHAGTRLKNGQVVTDGGRVLCVCALGETVRQAQAGAYSLVGKIRWAGEHHRSDIGFRAIARE